MENSYWNAVLWMALTSASLWEGKTEQAFWWSLIGMVGFCGYGVLRTLKSKPGNHEKG